jgi:hypothetical protein
MHHNIFLLLPLPEEDKVLKKLSLQLWLKEVQENGVLLVLQEQLMETIPPSLFHNLEAPPIFQVLDGLKLLIQMDRTIQLFSIT